MYSIYAELRDKKGMSDYSVAKIIGVGRSTLSDWKTGKHTPNKDNLKRIAEYFGVSVDYLMTGIDAPNETYYANPETAKIAQELFDNPDLRVLFDAAKDAKPEDLKLAADMLKRFKESNPDG